jgi:hypothetical protein
LIQWILKKVRQFRAPNPDEVISPLIQCDEILKIRPDLDSKFPIKLAEYRKLMLEEHGFDLVNEIASTLAVGELTIEQHARKMVRVYYENCEPNDESWINKLVPEIESVSKQVSDVYGT